MGRLPRGSMGHPVADTTEISKWFKRAQKGDETAISRLIDLTQTHLYRFCLYLTNDPQKAEDITQETLIKVLENLDSIEDPTKLMSWLFRAAKNRFIDGVRSPQAKEISTEGENETAFEPEPSQVDTDTVLGVRNALAALTEDERAVLVLIDSEGHTYEEAAQVIGITEEAVRSRLHRARKAFLKIFSKE